FGLCVCLVHSFFFLRVPRRLPIAPLCPYRTIFGSGVRPHQRVNDGVKARLVEQAVEQSYRKSGRWTAEEAWHVSAIRLLHSLLQDRESTRLNSSHVKTSYAVFCLKEKKI